MKAELERQLSSLCDRTRLEVPAGRILVPSAPIELIGAATELTDEETATSIAWNGFGAHAADTWGQETWRPALSFCWLTTAGEWEFPLMLLRLDEGPDFLCTPMTDDGGSETVIAALAPRASRDVMAAFLTDVVETNGAEYGFPLFGSIPARTDDHLGLPREAFVEAYSRWMERHPHLSTWEELREDVERTSIDPPIYRGEEQDRRALMRAFVEATVIRVL